MGIREDIRQALACISASIPEAVHTVRSGEAAWNAVKATRSDFADTRADGPAEDAAYYLRADLGELVEGAVVTLDGSPRAVTSLRMDAVGATLRVGMSRELVTVSAVIEAHGQHIETSVRAAVYEDDGITQGGGGFYQVDGENVMVFVSEGEWTGSEDPKFGVKLAWGGKSATVQHVSRGGGFWKLSAVVGMMGRQR